MLTEIRFQNFKSFVDQRARLGPLTMLVGANASGKSNFVDGLRVLQGIGLELDIPTIFKGTSGGSPVSWPGLRGQEMEAAWLGEANDEKILNIDTIWNIEQLLKYSFSVILNGASRVSSESLYNFGLKKTSFENFNENIHGEAGKLFPVMDYSNYRKLIAKNYKDNSNFPFISTAQSSFMAQSKDLIQFIGNFFSFVPGTTQLRESLGNITFLDPNPRLMRSYTPKDSKSIGQHGENVSSKIFQLISQDRDSKLIIDWISQLCSPEISGFDFADTSLGDVMLMIVEGDGKRISARSLSDGTLRFLAILVALRTVPSGSLLIIEEIESGLHPARQHLLVEALEGMARERDLQIVCTTHSPTVLSSLTEEHLRNAILFARIPEEPGTVMRNLGDLPHFDEIRARKGIEYLFTTGWLETAL